MSQYRIVKVGGDLLEKEAQFKEFIHAFSSIEGNKILVHGGGKEASRLLDALNIPVKYHEGRRITDAKTMEIVTMVYGGLINKNVVAKLQAIGVSAIGMAGCDGNIINAHKRIVDKIDYGYAGDIDYVNSNTLIKLMDAGLVPVICPLTHDGQGQLLNTNADTITSEIGISLAHKGQVKLHYCFGINGVLRDFNDKESVIEGIDELTFQKLRSEGNISAGMIPKLTNAFSAIKSGVSHVTIGNHTHFIQPSGYTQIL
jgi:acetylglutamate kinase